MPAPQQPDTPHRETTLEAMNRLSDMTRFPVAVHLGATVNVLITVAFTLPVYIRWGSSPCALPLWITFVLCINLMPVAALRAAGWRAALPSPQLTHMSFFTDQHRFADWVYLAASANMAFWIAMAWCADARFAPVHALLGVQAIALVCTFAPVWLRLLKRRSA